MRRIASMIFLAGFLLGGCTAEPVQEVPAESAPETVAETEEERVMKLKIDDMEVAVQWEDNDSVAALRKAADAQPLTVQMSRYGGFEQVGPLGMNLPRQDVQTVTDKGDIVLYSGNQIVIFTGSNTWAYTRLGRIIPKDADKLTQERDVTLTIYTE